MLFSVRINPADYSYQKKPRALQISRPVRYKCSVYDSYLTIELGFKCIPKALGMKNLFTVETPIKYVIVC